MKMYAAVLIGLIGLLSVSSEASTLTGTRSVAAGQVVTKTKVTTRKASHRTKVTTKKAAHRTKRGTKHVYSKAAVKTRPVRRSTWRGGRKVVSRTKKVLN